MNLRPKFKIQNFFKALSLSDLHVLLVDVVSQVGELSVTVRTGLGLAGAGAGAAPLPHHLHLLSHQAAPNTADVVVVVVDGS